MCIKFTKGGSAYELSTIENLFKIVRDGEVIHVQFTGIYQEPLLDLGLKPLNDILWNTGEYIEFCEAKKIYKGIEFTSDEWEKHTKIYAEIQYTSEGGEESIYKKEIDHVQGNMRGTQGDRLISEKYHSFVCGTIESKTIFSREDLRKHLSRTAGKTIYNL